MVFDDLGVAQLEGTSSLAASAAVDITACLRQLEEDFFHVEITQAFTVARSHYEESIDLETMSLNFTPGYKASELDEIEMAVTHIVRNLVSGT